MKLKIHFRNGLTRELSCTTHTLQNLRAAFKIFYKQHSDPHALFHGTNFFIRLDQIDMIEVI